MDFGAPMPTPIAPSISADVNKAQASGGAARRASSSGATHTINAADVMADGERIVSSELWMFIRSYTLSHGFAMPGGAYPESRPTVH
jgi:hypothetical protein